MSELEPFVLDSYWFEFEPTTSNAINKVLSEIAQAGRAYHSTERWDEEGWIDRIQDAAEEAAAEIERLTATPPEKLKGEKG